MFSYFSKGGDYHRKLAVKRIAKQGKTPIFIGGSGFSSEPRKVGFDARLISEIIKLKR